MIVINIIIIFVRLEDWRLLFSNCAGWDYPLADLVFQCTVVSNVELDKNTLYVWTYSYYRIFLVMENFILSRVGVTPDGELFLAILLVPFVIQ